MTYEESLRWLFGIQRFGIKLGLENTRRLFASLEIPSPNERIIHVAGTNGKGSVCAMLDAICRAGAYRTGLFTSPHLITFRERIQVDGELIAEEDVARGLTNLKSLVSAWEPHPTFFEIVTALALKHFASVGVDIVILETGMGGRLDSTNATQPIVSVITPIDYDHQKWLGHTLTEIAREKAGIIKERTPVVSAMQPNKAAEVIQARAGTCRAPLEFVRQSLEKFAVGLRGRHQKENAALALAALRAAEIPIDEAAIARGLSNVRWPARCQLWDERTIIDGAHNPAGARVLVETFREIFPAKKARVIFAVLADKDVAAICAALAPTARDFLFPQIQSPRAVSPQTLSLTIQTQWPEIPVATFASFAEAWDEARQSDEPILITGSLHFAGEALAFLRGETELLEECLQ